MNMPMPTVADAHRKLERLVGSWTGTETMHPSPFDPKGGSATGRITNTRALDGFIVIQDYEQQRNGKVSFRGHGVFSYNTFTSQYAMHWWDSLGFPPHDFVGDFEGDVLSLVYESPMGKHRSTMELSGTNRYTFRMELSGDGSNWKTFMEGDYTRT